MGRKGFEQEPVFFTMDGARRIRDDQVGKFENGILPLSPGSDYEFRIYHYVSRPTFQPSQLRVTISGKGVEPISSATLMIESEYDWMNFRIRTTRPSGDEVAVLNVGRADTTGQLEWSFDITTRTKPAYLAILGWGLAVGVFLAVPQAYGAWNDTNPSNNLNVPIVAFLVNMIAGVMAAYGFRRSF